MPTSEKIGGTARNGRVVMTMTGMRVTRRMGVCLSRDETAFFFQRTDDRTLKKETPMPKRGGSWKGPKTRQINFSGILKCFSTMLCKAIREAGVLHEATTLSSA